MKKQQELREVLQRFTADKPVLLTCDVISVDKNNQTAKVALDKDGDIVITARLNPVIDGTNNGFIAYPKAGTTATIGRLAKTEKFELLKATEIDSVEVMGGSNGGMVQVGELTTKLNSLITKIETQLGLIGDGIQTAGGAYEYVNGTIGSFNRDDYENTNFTH